MRPVIPLCSWPISVWRSFSLPRVLGHQLTGTKLIVLKTKNKKQKNHREGNLNGKKGAVPLPFSVPALRLDR